MFLRTREAAVVAALGVAALALFLLAPTYPNYDAYYHLVWGRELVHGITPTFEAYQAPTEHPLYIAIAAVLGVVFGSHADRALVGLGALSLVWLAWATWRVGRACFGTWAGLLAGLFVASSFAFLLYAARAYDDVPFLALVLTAAMVEAETPAEASDERRRRRSRAVLGVLVFAGLLRPEAWVLGGLYWLWRGWRRFDLLALACVAPLTWALVDALVTGDPLHSLHATSGLADELGRARGIGAVPGSFVRFVFDVSRPPVAVAGVLGLAFALLVTRPGGAARGVALPGLRALRLGDALPSVRALQVPLALLLAGTITFVASGAAGLSVLPRYLTVPVVALCLFAGHAVAVLGRDRRLLTAMVVVGLAFLGLKAGSFSKLHTELSFIRTTHRDLTATLNDPRVQRARACGPVTLPNYRLTPDTKWALDSEAVGARSARRRDAGVALYLVGTKPIQRYGRADGASPATNVTVDHGFVPIARHGMFVAYAACPR